MKNEEFIQSIALPGEEWRDVVGYEGLYSVSSFGRIISLGKFRTYKNRNGHFVQPFLMSLVKGTNNGKHYYNLSLCKNGKNTRTHVHRIVARAFLPNPNNYSDVDHINRDGLDNRVENLRWCSRTMNMLNENSRIVMSASQRKKKLPSLNKAVVCLKDGEIIKEYESITEATKYGFTYSGIIETAKGRQRSHRGLQWKYLADYESQVSMSKNSEPNS